MCCGTYRRKVNNAFVLESSNLNVRIASFEDLAENLSVSWKGNICDYGKHKGSLHPDDAWLDNFWAMVVRTGKLPAELSSYMIVPVNMPGRSGKKRLASPDFCQQKCALSASHLKALPANSADVLSAIGCLCILITEADCASPIAITDEPITAALAAAASCSKTPLNQLVSPDLRFKGSNFDTVRDFLADHVNATEAQQDKVWSILKQCTIFEDSHGTMIDLAQSTEFMLLPNAAWEQQLGQLAQLLPAMIIPYHSASRNQRQLLKASGLKPAELPDFICNVLMPAVESEGDCKWEPLVLQALSHLAAYPTLPRNISSLMVGGQWYSIDRLVDSSSNLLKTLFDPDRTGQCVLHIYCKTSL